MYAIVLFHSTVQCLKGQKWYIDKCKSISARAFISILHSGLLNDLDPISPNNYRNAFSQEPLNLIKRFDILFDMLTCLFSKSEMRKSRHPHVC